MALSFQNKIRPVATSTVSFASKARPVATTPTVEPQAEGGGVSGFVKGLVTAPATMIARPFQAASDLGDYLGTEMAKRGQSPEVQASIIAESGARQKEKQTESTLGGVVAPTPASFSDVKKDVGRGVQTVALGTGAPIAGGAAFGFGASLEQGNDVFSTETLTNTLIGMGAGKALDLVGKPLLNASGKVIGTITPKVIKDVAAQGAGAVEKFMAQHELLGGAVKPLAERITTGAQAFDTGVNKLFKGAGQTVSAGVKSQYPDTTEKIAKHYEDVEMKRLFEPTKVAGKTYNKSTDVLKDAQRRGVDLKKVASDNKIYVSEHIKDGKFDTKDIADTLADETMSGGPEILRPALAAADPGVQRIPIQEVRNRVLSKISKVKDTVLSPKQKLAFAEKVAKEYADDSITAQVYKDGYNLTNLYDSKLQTSSKLYKAPKTGGVQSISDSLIGQQKKIESEVFDELLRKNAPKELGLDTYFKAQEGRFTLANYLRTLDGNKAPQTLFQRGVRRAAQLAGATTGAQVAGPFGMFSGYQFGGIVSDTFSTASNPVKVAYLKSIGKTEPEIYKIMKNYVTSSELAKLLRPKLSAPTTIFQGPTQAGKPYTPNTAGFRTTPVVETKSTRLFKDKK